MLTIYLCSFLNTAFAEADMAEIELIELLGEFNQEDELMLEETMIDIRHVDAKHGKQIEQTGASDENTAD
jgi:hypothetical protein